MNMEDMKSIVQVAVDAYKGNVTKYSVNQSMDLLREAAIQANNGKTTINYKDIRDGKCVGLFALLEEILERTVIEGLTGNEFFMSMVDYRNVKLGDKNEFLVQDDDYFAVAEIAEGTQGVRRQRLHGMNKVSIPTSLKAVKIYEELNRILSGQTDFNRMITRVGESFQRQINDDIYALWNSATAADLGGATYFPAAGAYDEATLLNLIAHVEAAAGGKQATIIGTKVALRNLAPSIQGNESKGDLYNLGLTA